MSKSISAINISHEATCGECPPHSSQIPAPTMPKNFSSFKPFEVPSETSGSVARKYNLDSFHPAPSPSSALRVRIMLSLCK